MRYYFSIPCGQSVCCYTLLPYGDYQRIDIDGVVILEIYKHHDHRFDLRGFFYAKKLILSRRSFRSKKELYFGIQYLLQENLDGSIQ